MRNVSRLKGKRAGMPPKSFLCHKAFRVICLYALTTLSVGAMGPTEGANPSSSLGHILPFSKTQQEYPLKSQTIHQKRPVLESEPHLMAPVLWESF